MNSLSLQIVKPGIVEISGSKEDLGEFVEAATAAFKVISDLYNRECQVKILSQLVAMRWYLEHENPISFEIRAIYDLPNPYLTACDMLQVQMPESICDQISIERTDRIIRKLEAMRHKQWLAEPIPAVDLAPVLLLAWAACELTLQSFWTAPALLPVSAVVFGVMAYSVIRFARHIEEKA